LSGDKKMVTEILLKSCSRAVLQRKIQSMMRLPFPFDATSFHFQGCFFSELLSFRVPANPSFALFTRLLGSPAGTDFCFSGSSCHFPSAKPSCIIAVFLGAGFHSQGSYIQSDGLSHEKTKSVLGRWILLLVLLLSLLDAWHETGQQGVLLSSLGWYRGRFLCKLVLRPFSFLG